ncbi:unnamed protein product [Cuscuta epithymum]|uniref:Uncharacterized protein n=1 Tax=Cuscuta epithymum TaxID=186058 RepID=A0AAV0CJJ0_9ASTE|nr:unnamed protein product [Cuscuta epithymum]CAH9145694.1 unnamed protein product [Cuscuta epithymum]
MTIPLSIAEMPGWSPAFSGARAAFPSRVWLMRLRSMPVPQQFDSEMSCEPCSGMGWILCDFCKGLKTNVQSETKKIYRRCPSCRAIGYRVCWKCKVFKCVTYPNRDDHKKPNL